MKRRPATPLAFSATPPDPTRRRVLRYGVNALGMIAAGQLLSACRNDYRPPTSLRVVPRTLHASAVPELLLPEGFSARVIARSGEPVVEGRTFRWHAAPDGGAVFATEDGGWIYVSNSEMNDGLGGVSAVRFNARGEITDAYPILTGTHRNCAGGPTPWRTWLSCEEVPNGHVWECDPLGRMPPRELPALGAFMHEAVAVDPQSLQLYMTEDERDGRFYRYTPARVTNGIPDLAQGTLEVAEVSGAPGGRVTWRVVEDPAARVLPTRYQVPQSTLFAGGEGAWYAERLIYFTTKRDNRVWVYDTDTQHLDVVYDDDSFAAAPLTGVDNVTVSQAGIVYVAEDSGSMQIVGIDPEQEVFPVLKITGHDRSEITGPAFDPSGTRLYFSSQRGASGSSEDGITYEVTGPFQ